MRLTLINHEKLKCYFSRRNTEDNKQMDNTYISFTHCSVHQHGISTTKTCPSDDCISYSSPVHMLTQTGLMSIVNAHFFTFGGGLEKQTPSMHRSNINVTAF